MRRVVAVGTKDPDPHNWRCWEDVVLYIAKSKLEAVWMDNPHMTEDDAKRNAKDNACFVDMSVSQHLMDMPDYIGD